MDTRYYWKPLSELINDYMNHPEAKSEGDIGPLKRRYITIDENSIHYIGKESNELDESQIIGVDGDNYTEYTSVEATVLKLLSLTPREALKIGMSKTQYYEISSNFKEGKFITFKNKKKIKLQGFI